MSNSLLTFFRSLKAPKLERDVARAVGILLNMLRRRRVVCLSSVSSTTGIEFRVIRDAIKHLVETGMAQADPNREGVYVLTG